MATIIITMCLGFALELSLLDNSAVVNLLMLITGRR